jgi:hypothetical protein
MVNGDTIARALSALSEARKVVIEARQEAVVSALKRGLLVSVVCSDCGGDSKCSRQRIVGAPTSSDFDSPGRLDWNHDAECPSCVNGARLAVSAKHAAEAEELEPLMMPCDEHPGIVALDDLRDLLTDLLNEADIEGDARGSA